MFKKITFILLMSVAAQTSYANFSVGTFEYFEFNTIFKKQFKKQGVVRYEPEKNFVTIFFGDQSGFFAVSMEETDQFSEQIMKFKEWNLKASKKKVKLEKEIGKFPIKLAFWQQGRGELYVGFSEPLSSYFFSRSTEKHQYVLRIPKITSTENQYITHRETDYYFDYAQALKFRSLLDKSAIEKAYKKHKQQEALESEFN